MQSGVYKISFKGSDKCYYGSAVNIFRRVMYEHLPKLRRGVHENNILQKAFNKYGEKQFSYETVEECGEDFLIEREQYWLNSNFDGNTKLGYNICAKANSWKGNLHTEATKKKIGDANRGRHPSEETKKKMSDAHKKRIRKPLSDETKMKISIARTGYKCPEEVKRRMKTRRASEETKRKMSDAKRGKHHSGQFGHGNRHSFSGNKHSETTKQKIRNSVLRYLGGANASRVPV